MNKKTLFIISGVLVLGLIACSPQKKLKSTSEKSSLLWKISGKDLNTPSYIFGTIHLICPDKFIWTDKMKSAFNASKQLVLEMNLSDPSVTAEVTSGLMLAEGQSLKDYYSVEDYVKIEQYAKDSLQIPPFLLSRMQPFSVLSMTALNKSNCRTNPISYEEKLMTWANENNMMIKGLESAQDQLKIVKTMNKDSTAQQLLRFVENPKKMDAQYGQLIKAYTQQNLNALYQLILSSPEMEADLNTVLFDRNSNWVPQIEKLMKEGTSFIAVGAGHLAGKGGVLQILQRAGYIVEPVF